MTELADELRELSQRLEALKSHFFSGEFGVLTLPTEQEAKWSALIREAKDLSDEALGHANSVSMRLVGIASALNFSGGASMANVEEAQELVASVIRRLERRPRGGLPTRPGLRPSTPPFVDPSRIAALHSLTSDEFDFQRLARLCEEINIAWEGGALHAVTMLGRAIIDHVPPLFRQSTFGSVASSYGSKSFKDSMTHLDKGLRSTADDHLHGHIRARETLPTTSRADFRSSFDVLLGEIAGEPWKRLDRPVRTGQKQKAESQGTGAQTAPLAKPAPVQAPQHNYELIPGKLILRGVLSDDGIDVTAHLQYRNRSTHSVAIKAVLASFEIDGRVPDGPQASMGVNTPVRAERTETVHFKKIRIFNRNDPSGSVELAVEFGLPHERTILRMRYSFTIRSYPANKSTDQVLDADVTPTVSYEVVEASGDRGNSHLLEREPIARPVTASDLATVRVLFRLWGEKLLQVRSKNGALLALQMSACSEFLADIEALYGPEVRRRVERRFPAFVDQAVEGSQRDAQMKTAAMQDLKQWDAELTLDRLSPDHADLPRYMRERVTSLRAEAPHYGLIVRA